MSIFDIGNGFGIIDDVVGAMEHEERVKKLAASYYRCPTCSKANRCEKFSSGDEVPFPPSCGVTILHDIAYQCENLYYLKQRNDSCTRGDKKYVLDVCKACRYGKPTDIKYTVGTGRQKMDVTKTLYKCTNKEQHYGHKGEYCTPFYTCDHFTAKDEEKKNGEKDG
jgi:hypothetical protein